MQERADPRATLESFVILLSDKESVIIPGGNKDKESDHLAGQEVTEDVGEPPFIIVARLLYSLPELVLSYQESLPRSTM